MGSDGLTQTYITNCSHMFCVECGEKHFSKQLVCPGCDKTLSDPGQIQIINLNPSEEQRQMQLCGLDPETIMEVAGRGLSFYAYQKQNEIAYLSFLNKKTQQKMQQLEKGFDDRLAQAHKIINTLNGQLKLMKEEIASGKKDYNDLQERFSEKTRQKRKLEELFDVLKQKYDNMVKNRNPGSLSPQNFQSSPDHSSSSSRATPALGKLPRNFPSPSLPLGGIGGSTASRRLPVPSSSSSLSSSSSCSSSPRFFSTSSSSSSSTKSSSSFNSAMSPAPRPLQLNAGSGGSGSGGGGGNSGDRWQKMKENIRTSYGQNPLHRPGTPSFSTFLKPKSVLEE